MEANRANPQQPVARSNKKHDKCIVNLSIATVVLCTITMVTVVTLHWMWLSSHPSTEFHTVLLASVMILYTITTINSLVIILKVDKRKNQNVIGSEQVINTSDSSNANNFQRSMADRISLPNLHGTRFEDITPQPNYAQTTVHRNYSGINRSKSEKTIRQGSTSTSTSSGEDGSTMSSRYESEGYGMSDLRTENHNFEMNLRVPQHQRLTRLPGTTTITDTSTKYVPGFPQEQIASSQVEPIYENMFVGKLPTNTGLNIFDVQKPKCEKVNVAKLLKSNVDISELNNGQQLVTVKKSPIRNSSFQKSNAQTYSKHNTEVRNVPQPSSSYSPPSIMITSASGGTRPFISSEDIFFSEASSNREYVNANLDGHRHEMLTEWTKSRNAVPQSSSSNATPSITITSASGGIRPFISSEDIFFSESSSNRDYVNANSTASPLSRNRKFPSASNSNPVTSGGTRSFINSEQKYAISSETWSNRACVNGNSSSESPRCRNRQIPSSSANPYISSQQHKLCTGSKVTTVSSGFPKTSTAYKVPPVRRMVCSSSIKVAPSYSEGALNEACLPTENFPNASANYESEPNIFEEHCKGKCLPEKLEEKQKSTQKTKIIEM